MLICYNTTELMHCLSPPPPPIPPPFRNFWIRHCHLIRPDRLGNSRRGAAIRWMQSPDIADAVIIRSPSPGTMQ